MIRDDESRKAILQKVKSGELSPQAAEEWASTRGLKPFAYKPDLSKQRSTPETTWSLPMAMAWLIWRSSDAVVEASDAHRAKWKRWDTVPRREATLGDSFWVPVPVGRASLAELIGHPDNRHLPIDRLFDPSLTDLTRSLALSECSPFDRLCHAAETGALNAMAEFAGNARRDRTRQPFPFLINYLREQLRQAKRRLPSRLRDGTALYPPISHDAPDFVTSGIEYFDIRVPKVEVIAVDLEASRLEYAWSSWTTEHVLGWIAYRSATTFRLIAPFEGTDTTSRVLETCGRL